MSKKQEPVKPVEEEDEEASSEEVDSQDSDSEPEQTKTATPSVKPQPSPMPQNQPPSSSDEQETESDSDGPDSNVTPPASKAVEKTQKSSHDTKKATTSKPAVTKRPSEDTPASKDAKKAKMTAEPEILEKKSNLFQRLWSEDDEIVILKGMIEFSANNKSDAHSNLNAFHNDIQRSLHMDFTRVQLQDKMRRLKKKYEKNKSRGKENFANAHEQRAYDLSKEIWGNESKGEKLVGSPKANGRKSANKKGNAAGESGEVNNLVAVSGAKRMNPSSGGAGLEERMLMNGRKIYEVGSGVEGEKKWEKLKLEETELYLKQLEVRVAQTKLVLKAGDR